MDQNPTLIRRQEIPEPGHDPIRFVRNEISSLFLRPEPLNQIFDFLSKENCRVCKKLMRARESEAMTICRKCWIKIINCQADLDTCPLNQNLHLKVAHADLYRGELKSLIYKLKYDGDTALAGDLSWLLLKAYCRLLDEIDCANNTIIIPIPLHYFRKLKRGFNQSELLARHLSRITRIPLNASLLRRSKFTRAQHCLDRESRLRNIARAFSCSSVVPDSVTYLLVDDIHTSGATLAEAARVLIGAGAKKLAAVTIARASFN